MSAHQVNARLETFCDGVLAIAITLLILEIKVPSINAVHSANDLWLELVSHWPSWFALILSFGTTLIAWVNHRTFFGYLDKSSTPFIYANGFFLLTMVVLPFPTALMAEYLNTDYAKPAIIIYCLTSLVHNISWLLMFYTASKPVNLYKSEFLFTKGKAGISYTKIGFLLYCIICVIAFWFPITAIILTSLTWLVWIVVGVVYSNET